MLMPWMRVYNEDGGDNFWDEDEPENFPPRVWLENNWWIECAGDDCDAKVVLDTVGGERANGEVLCRDCAAKEGLARPDWLPDWAIAPLEGDATGEI